MLQVAPFSVDFGDDDDDEWDTSKGLRIMGLSYVPDLSQAAFCCMIAPDGECTDHLRLPHLLKRKNSFREEEKMLKVYKALILLFCCIKFSLQINECGSGCICLAHYEFSLVSVHLIIQRTL